MASQKISEFNSVTSLSDTALITVVINGTNVNIPYSDFKSSLGVTGTLSQAGNTLAAPVLDQEGDNYNIRNIESSKGIIANVSAENGVVLSANFTQSSGGSPVITDLNADQYQFKTFVAGTNIAITETDDHLTIGFNPTSGSSKTIVVSDISDFPDPVSGVITLTADTDYLVVDDISTANRFVVSRPNTLRAASSQMVMLEYTGVGDMFTGVDPSFKIVNITVSCPNGNLFNTTSPTLPGIVQMVESNVQECETLGTIDGNFITRFTNTAFENIKTNGLTFAGTNEILVVDVGVSFLMGGSLIDLGTSTFNSVSIESGVIPVSSVGTFFLSGLPNSGNIAPGGLGVILNNKGFGSGTALSGITTDDARWNFLANNNIPDTRPDALLTFNTPTTTVLAAATPALINGVWTLERASQMTETTAGRITYDGEKAVILPISCALSLQPVSGTNKDINIYFAKNGVVVTNSKVSTTVSASSPKNQSVLWQDSWNVNDYYEVFIESVDGTDVQVNTANFRVN